MKNLYHTILRSYLWLGLHFYFSRITLLGAEHIPGTGALIFTANHQNAFLDALLIATFNKRSTYFLTRASVFKNPIARFLLESINMRPVFRVRDGWNTIQQNDQTFNECIEELHQGGSVGVFPEGNHDMRRRLRPLSKGFTRIAFGMLDQYPDQKLQIIPIGLNYEDHTQARTAVSMHFGESILVNGFYNAGNFQGSSQALKTSVSERMKRLTGHIELETYDETLAELTEHNYDFTDPDAVNEAIFKNKYEQQSRGRTNILFQMLRVLLFLPAFVWNILPALLWPALKPLIKDPVFEGSIKFALSISLAPLIYLLQSVVIGNYFGLLAGITALGFSLISYPILKGK